MLNGRYGTLTSMLGNFDAHLPVLMRGSRFVFSPNGVGEQCYREYEALVAGTYPLVDASSNKHRNAILDLFAVLVRPAADGAGARVIYCCVFLFEQNALVTVLGLGARTSGRSPGETARVADSSAAGACRFFITAYLLLSRTASAKPRCLVSY